jgi:hypothetical protein
MSRFRTLVFAGAILGSMTAPATADQSALRGRLVAEDGWAGYHVPIVVQGGSPCCYSDRIREVERGGCDLDTRRGTLVSDDRAARGQRGLSVYWHVTNGKPDQIRAFAADCPVASREEIRWIDPVDPIDSVEAITHWVEQAGSARGHDTSALAAIAFHAHEQATLALIALAEAGDSAKQQEGALFWLGQLRGVPGADYVQRVATRHPSAKMREHAVFALSQSNVPDAYARIVPISRNDASAEVRGRALFWMAQMQDPRARDDILAALEQDHSQEVREQAVFALSQLHGPDASTALIALVRGDHSRFIKEKALFWLGQSGSDEAMAFLDELLKRQGKP